jgi:succinyl-CoA synthetase alpha subunit
MAILVDRNTRVLIQGITGKAGSAFSRQILETFPALLVAGVTPGRAGQNVLGIPVYGFVADAVEASGADLALICVPARHFKDAAIEAIDAGINCLVAYIEGVPIHDAIVVAAYARRNRAILIGPNTAGIMSPLFGAVGELNANAAPAKPGRLGIVTKSGSIALDTMELTAAVGGQSTVVCLGGDEIVGASFSEILLRFENDPDTDAIVMIGEVGGRDEAMAADVVAGMKKPVVAYVSGHTAPPGQKMGHAGALISAGYESAAAKSDVLRRAGALVAPTLPEIVPLLQRALAACSRP